MGLDLRLLPFDSYPGSQFGPVLSTGVNFSHTLLSVFRRRALFDKIRHLKATPVPPDFYSFTGRHCGADDPNHEKNCGEHGYGITTETPYGDPLDYVLVEDLLPFAQDEGVQDNPTNRAIWAYLAHLDPKTPIALYWH